MHRKWCVFCLWQQQLEERDKGAPAITNTYHSFGCCWLNWHFFQPPHMFWLTSHPSQSCCCWRSSTQALVQTNILLTTALSTVSISLDGFKKRSRLCFPVCFVSPGETYDIRAQVAPNNDTKMPENTTRPAPFQDKYSAAHNLDQVGNENPETQGTTMTFGIRKFIMLGWSEDLVFTHKKLIKREHTSQFCLMCLTSPIIQDKKYSSFFPKERVSNQRKIFIFSISQRLW